MEIDRKIIWLCALMLFALSAAAQYRVTGGSKEPLLAVDNSNYRTKVFLVYGTSNLQISYTSSSTSHKWYRYREKVDDLNPEKVASMQNGTTSTISNVEPGYGYYVDENGAMRHYVWIIDYSRYVPDIRNIKVSDASDHCSSIRLEGGATLENLVYYTPNGLPTVIKREFEIGYGTLAWNAELGLFSPDTYTKKFDTDPFGTSFPPPLDDTEITLSGDSFAQYFGVEVTATTPLYQSRALDVYAAAKLINQTTLEETDATGGELSAPANVRFSAYANKPIAALFRWTIYNNEDTENPLIMFTQEEVEYTFNRHGTYTAKLEVSDRSGMCLNEEHTFTINITETEMKIPNAFSPGCTPGVNDYFMVVCKSVVNFRGWIFNRWGTELFHWTDPKQGWDGKYKGKYVGAGVYYYLIEYTGTDGKTHKRTGDVNVFRSKEIETEKEDTQ